MKRNMLLRTVLLMLGLLLALTGCNTTEPPQSNDSSTDSSTVESEGAATDTSATVPPCTTCTYGEWQTVQAATCKQDGTQTRTCTVCGATQTAPLAKTEHLFGEWVRVTEPTVEAVGLQKRTCAACGEAETEELPKLAPLFSVSCNLGNKTVVVTASEDGSYTLSAPECAGYSFLGWKTEAGADFAATGKLTENAKVVAQWEVVKTTTFAQLKSLLELGVDKVLVDADIVLSETIYVTGETTLYVTEDHTLIRSPEFVGDLFILGETANGENTILTTGKAAALTLCTEDDTILTLSGNKAEMNEDAMGTVFFLVNSATLNLYDGVVITECKKVGNTRTIPEETMSQPHRVGGAAVIVADGVLNLYGATISDCEVNLVDKKTVEVDGEPEEMSNDSSCGGAIFNRSTVNMYSGSLLNNQASRGGAIFSYRTCHVKAGLIDGNYASTYGGALYMTDSQYINTTIGQETEEIKLTISNNTSEKSGGAIFGQHQSVLMVYGGVKFDSNKSLTSNGGAINMAGALTVKGGTFVDNLAASKGGALYLYYSDPDQTVREVDIAGGIFEGNEASRGGAIAMGASKSTYETGAKVKIGDAIFRGNRSFLTEEEDPSFIDNVDRENVTKEENGKGGAIYVFWKADLTVYGKARFEANTAEDYGGAIYVTTEGSKLTIDATAESQPLFLGNTAAGNGGALYFYTGTVLNANYATFRGNEASGEKYGGGAIYFTGSKGTFANVVFEGNKSLTKNGGAVCAYSQSELTMTDVTFTENLAEDDGGALCINKSKLEANGLILTGNRAAGGGGALYLTGAASELNASDIVATCNHADGNGGALYFYTDSVAQIGALTVSQNTSDEYGGSIYASGEADVDITTVSATANTASKGGFLYLTTGGTTVTILSGSASDNVAPDGGATAYSHSTGAVLELTEDFVYPADTITGKSGFHVTLLPAEENA